jgi:hypothetical protein
MRESPGTAVLGLSASDWDIPQMARKNHRVQRAGFLNSIEFGLYLPIVILLFVAIVQFSKVLSTEARLAGASREGVRVAASGGNSTQISNAVFAALLPVEKNLVSIETNAVDSQGHPAVLVSGAVVVVRVSMPTKKAVSKPLSFVFNGNQELVGQTVMRKE